MFTRKKLSALSSSSLVRPSGSVQARLRGIGTHLWAGLKKPYVAPLLALGGLAGAGALFLGLAANPEAGSPQIRVNLARFTPVETTASETGELPLAPLSGDAAFGLDSVGMFEGNSASGFALQAEAGPVDGTAVITLPDNGSPVTVPARGKLAARPLTPAPIAGLFEPGPDGNLPIIGADGRTPSQAYARPFKSNGKPRVALIVGGLGLNPATTRAAIEQLPAEVTLSFVPYADGLQNWIDMARAQGHEVLIEMPMEPVDYPATDPGPKTLMIKQSADETQSRLKWVLGQASGYFGVINYQGSAYLRDKTAAPAFTNALKLRGLTFIDDGQGRGLTGAWGRASADRVVDAQLNAASIQNQLAGLEATAKARGHALGTGFAYPVTLAVAIKWTQGLEEKGLQLAPASAIARQ